MRVIGTVIVCALLASNLSAQEKEVEGSLNSGTLEQQFNYMLAKSNRYKDFKVIKQTYLHTYWSHVADTLKNLHSEISSNQSTIAMQSNEIAELKGQLSNKIESLTNVEEERDSISFLGADMDKGIYKKIMWSIAFGLLALLILTFIRFKSSKSITKSTKLKLSEIEEEFDGHKRRALEKEQQLKRELQNEINKADSHNPPR